jgi:translation initiation factor IF-2
MYVYPNRLAYLHRHYCQYEEAGVMESEKTDKQSRKEAGLTREQAIDEAQRAVTAKRAEKRAAEEAEQLARERVRKEAWLAKEKAIEEAQRVAEAKRAEKRTAEEAEQLAKEQTRKEVWLARERAIEEERKARKARESENLDKR